MTLLVLAAGMGSRYGGLKQLDPMGPGGETMLDYSVYDALRAGFDRVVFVIRRDFEEEFRERIGSRYEDRVDVGYVFQQLNELPGAFSVPEGRTKPWGTGHAIWCARGAVDEPFVAINADDFYGRDAYERMAEFFAKTDEPTELSMGGYRLADTLSEHGAVSRGVCQVTEGGLLEGVKELTKIQREGTEIVSSDGGRRVLTGEETVSLNFWGFTPLVFDLLEDQLAQFLEAKGGEAKSEFYIPDAVATMIRSGQATVKVLPAKGPWFGVTYPEDKAQVVEALKKLNSEYPAKAI